jgi:hypothetical protein
MYDPISGEFVSFGDNVAVGYENAEIVGDAVDDIFGARIRNASGLAARMGADRNIDPNAVLVRSQVDTRRRYLDLGIPETAIAAGAEVLIEIRPQRVIRCEELLLPDTEASKFLITAAFVGQNSQFAGGSPIPGEAYSTKAAGLQSRLLWDTANPGITIQLRVKNIDAQSATFRGTLRGTTTVR